MSLGVEYGAVYVLEGPDGARAVFNDDSDEDFVGALDIESSGLDSPEVRESFYDLPEADGGAHNNFYHGRRPVILQGTIIASGVEDRNIKVGKLKAASNAMRADATLTWEPTGASEVFLNLRRQQPVRITGGFVKKFQVPLVSASAAIQSATLHEKTIAANNATVEAVNAGDLLALPTITVHGPLSNPDLLNTTTGKEIQISHVLVEGETLVIDFANHTIKIDGETESYDSLDFPASEWWELVPSKNIVKLTAAVFTAGAKAVVKWRDAYS